MASDIGVKLAVEGEKSFQSAIKSANAQIKAMDAELKAAIAGMDKMASSEEKAAAKSKILAQQVSVNKEKLETLNKKYDTAKDRLSALGAELERAKQEHGENSAEVTKAATAYNNQARAVADLERQIADTNTAINNETRELNQLNNKLLQTGQRLTSLGHDLQSTGQKITKVGTSMTKYVTTPLALVSAAAIKTTADFDSSMSKVQALSGATGKEFDALREKARALGADTKFSASEAADAMGNMALAGWDTQQMLTGIDGVLDLAAASGMDLAKSADVVAGNLAAFNMEAAESTRLADLIATAQAKSKTTADQLAEAYSTSATNMTQAGQAAETTTALLEGLASVNDTGSAAGTKLSAVMAQITKKMKNGKIAIGDTTVTVQDANGNFRDMIDIVEDVEKATYGMGDAERAAALQTTFNRQSMNGLNELLAVGSTQLRQYRTELENSSGSAAQMAETMQDNLLGQVTILKSQLQELAISFGDTMMPTIRGFVGSLQDAVDALNNMDDGTREMIVKAGLAAAAMGPVTHAVGKVTTGIGGAVAKAGEFATKLSGGGGVASALSSALGLGGTAGLAVAGLAAVTAGAIVFGHKIHDAIDPVIQIKKHLTELSDAQKRLSNAENIITLCTRYEELRAKTADTSLSAAELSAAQAELEEVRAALSEATNGAVSAEGEYNAALDKTVQAQKELAGVEKERSNQEIFTELVQGAKDYHKALEKQEKKKQEIAQAEEKVAHYTDQMTEATAKATSEIEKNGKISFSTKLAMDDAATCASGATKKYNKLQDELEELESATSEYESSLISLVRNGFLDAEDAATLLGTSEEGLRRKILALEQQELSAAKATQSTAEEHLDAAQAAQEQAEAEEELSTSLGEIKAAAQGALQAGGDLREKYDELKKQMDDLGESSDTEAQKMAELALHTLNLAATNQELTSSYSLMGIGAGDSLTSLSGFLIEAGISADEFASGVTSMRDSVVNDFQLIAEGNKISADQMVANLDANLKTQQAWSNNLKQLWEQSAAEQDNSVRAYINYLASKGPEYAGVVAEFAHGGYSKLQEAASLWSGIGEQSADDYAAGIYMQQYLSGEAGEAVGREAIDSASKLDYSGSGQDAGESWTGSFAQADGQTAGQTVMKSVVSGMNSQKSSLQSTAKDLASTVTNAWATADSKFRKSGDTAGRSLKAGLNDQKQYIKTAAQGCADAVAQAWTQKDSAFRVSGSAASSAIAGGISSGSGGISSAAASAASSAYSAVRGLGWYGLGYNISAGIASGVRAGSGLITNAARSAASSALRSAKSTLGIHSPSRVFRDEVGKMIPSGMAEGILGAQGAVSRALEAVSDNALSALKGNMAPVDVSAAKSGMRTAAGGSASGTVINIYPQPGQDENTIAELVMRKLDRSVRRREGALA